MSIAVCVAGKGRIAINALNEVLGRMPPDGDLYAVFNATEDGIDGWQPSFRKYVERHSSVKITTLDEVAQIENLVFLSMEFDRIIRPDRFLGAPCLVNMHFSLLPAYKGMFTSALPILNGEKESGCTLHLVDAGIDTGDIISQIRFPLAADETCKTLYAKYVAHGSALFAKHADRILSRGFEARPQHPEGSTYYSRKALDYANLAIDWNQTAEQVTRQIRAFNHRSYQLPTYADWRIASASVSGDRSTLKPGRQVRADAFSLTVATIDYDVALTIDEFDALIAASRDGDIDVLQGVITRNPTLAEESGKEGWTALMVAAFASVSRSVEALLALGADPNHANQKGTTPLMYAKDAFLRTGDASASQALIRAGADVGARDMWGRTVIDYLSEADKDRYRAMVLMADATTPSSGPT